MSSVEDFLARMVRALEAAGIPFMIAGSFASAVHGLPRTTQDIDIVIDPSGPDALDVLLSALPADAYYVDADVAHDALHRRGQFNIVDHATGWKLDLIIRKDREFSRAELARRERLEILGVPVFVASAEDTIIAKLEWSQQSGGSERQRRDVGGIIATVGEHLDREYVDRWVAALGLEDEWSLAQRADRS